LRALAQQNQQNNGNALQAQPQPLGSTASSGFELRVETKINGYFPGWAGKSIIRIHPTAMPRARSAIWSDGSGPRPTSTATR